MPRQNAVKAGCNLKQVKLTGKASNHCKPDRLAVDIVAKRIYLFVQLGHLPTIPESAAVVFLSILLQQEKGRGNRLKTV